MKRTLSAILSITLLLSLLLTALAFPASAESHLKKDKGLQVTPDPDNQSYPRDYYEAPKLLEEAPRTFEAWVYLSSSLGGAEAGVILGTDPDRTSGRFTFGIKKNGAPYIRTVTRAGAVHEIVFKNEADPNTNIVESYITPGDWVHLVIACDENAGEFRCYLNGELKGTAPFTDSCGEKCADECLGVLPYEAFTAYPLCLAGDHRHLNTKFFKGYLQDVAMYADVLSAEEIAASYKNGVDVDDENLILYYDIDSTDKRTDIPDLSGNGYDMLYSPAWLTETEMEEVRKEKGFAENYAYSIAVIGDIQYSTRLYPDAVKTMYQWIVDNQKDKNILYAIGVGDITDNCSVAEWYEAADALKIFENANLEYSLVRGNHDKGNGGDYSKEEPALHLYDEIFANNEFYTKQFDEYGGYYKEGSVINTYRTVNWGGVDRLLLNIDWSPTSDVLAWACEVVEKYPNHKVIVVTHESLHPEAARKTVGNKIWNEFAGKYANVEMILSGHCSYNDLVLKQEEGINGNTVTQMLIDPQRVDLMMKGMGIVTMFYFYEDGTTFDVEHYSTVKNRYFREVNQFTVDLKADCEPPKEYWDGTTSTAPKGSGTEEDPYLITHPSNLLWMAEQHYTYGADEKVIAPTTAVNPFEGKYFRQTRDIDLCGKTLYSIGYYYESEEKCAVFGGIYDGGGYSIMNATIKNPLSDTGESNLSTGIFGEIVGAQIRNVDAKELVLPLSENAGFIVGRANAKPSSKKASLIEACTVDVTSRLKTKAITTKNVSLGMIAGTTSDTTVSGCTTFANISLTSQASISAAQIVGTALGKTDVYECMTEGKIAVKCGTGTSVATLGDIVGTVIGTASIVNCTAKGAATVSGDGTHTVAAFAGKVKSGASLILCHSKNKTAVATEAIYENDAEKVQHTFTEWKKCDTGHTASCSHGCNISFTLPHKMNEEGYCEHCEVKITGASVTLGESISIKYYAEIKDTSILGTGKPVMEFAFNGKTVTKEGVLTNGEYVFMLDGISVLEMNDKIDATLILADGESKIAIASKTGYSIKKNCLVVLSKHSENANLTAVVNDLFIYADALQRYAAYNTHSLIASGTNFAPTSSLMPTASDKLTISKNNLSDCRVTDKGITFSKTPTVFIKLHIADMSKAEIKLNSVEYDKNNLTDLGNGDYMLNLPLTSPESFAENYTLNLYYDGNAQTAFTYGLNAFAFTTAGSTLITNQELYDLTLAAYRFFATVKAYKK